MSPDRRRYAVAYVHENVADLREPGPIEWGVGGFKKRYDLSKQRKIVTVLIKGISHIPHRLGRRPRPV